MSRERCEACAGTGLARAHEFGRIDMGPAASVPVVPQDFAAALTRPCAACNGRGFKVSER